MIIAGHHHSKESKGDLYKMTSAKCHHCQATMKIVKMDRFNKPHGFALISAGVLFLTAIPLEAVLGFALIPFGAVVAFSKKEVWHCPACSSFVNRANVGSQNPLCKMASKLADSIYVDSDPEHPSFNSETEKHHE